MRMKNISAVLVCFLISSLPLVAQNSSLYETNDFNIQAGTLLINNVNVTRDDANLYIAMDLDLTDLKIKSDREIHLEPFLVSESMEDTLSLKSAVVAGRNRYFHYLRNGGVEENKSLYRVGEKDIIQYSTVVPYEKWMEKSNLQIRESLCGCCKDLLALNDEQLYAIDYVPRVYEPQFIYIQPEVEKCKIREIKGSAFVDFPVNKTYINIDYRKNREEIAKIINSVELVRNDSDAQIVSLNIKGHASPEGPYKNNERLAKGRTEALIKYVRDIYHIPDSILSSSYEPEDWAGLINYLEASTMENKESILAIAKSDLDPDKRDAKIKKDYPADYQHLLKECYPALRHSDYVVEYQIRAYTDVEEAKEVFKNSPGKLSLSELYAISDSYEIGSEEFNNVFETAVRLYPDDEVANLNAANVEMSRGDMEAARRYLDKAGDSPKAIYAKGTYFAIKGDYEGALVMFNSALALGVKEAEFMMNQIDYITR